MSVQYLHDSDHSDLKYNIHYYIYMYIKQFEFHFLIDITVIQIKVWHWKSLLARQKCCHFKAVTTRNMKLKVRMIRCMKVAQEWIWKKVKLHHWMTLVHSSQFLAINKTKVFLLLFKLYHVHLIYLEFLCIYSVVFMKISVWMKYEVNIFRNVLRYLKDWLILWNHTFCTSFLWFIIVSILFLCCLVHINVLALFHDDVLGFH